MLWGIVVLALALLAWLGQTLAWRAPATAVRWKLVEAEGDVDPVFWADIRAEAVWDALSLWVMVGAGALLVADVSAWKYFGLVGGGMYLYFAGRGISARLVMARRGIRIGSRESLRVGVAFLAAWALMAVVTIIASIVAFAD